VAELRIIGADGSSRIVQRGPRFPIVQTVDGRFGIVDDATGELLAFTGGELRAWRLARIIRVLELTYEQVERLLDDPRFLQTITLRFDGNACWRCGRRLRVGQRARWNTITKLTRHVRACPKQAEPRAKTKSKPKASAKRRAAA
jgi:hypothetical protein